MQKLNGKQVGQLQAALLAAFPTKDDMRMLVRIELDESLDEIAGGDQLGVIVFNLVTWAEAVGRVPDLIQGACKRRGGNPDLRQLAQAAEQWYAASAPALSTDGSDAVPVLADTKEDPERNRQALTARFRLLNRLANFELDLLTRFARRASVFTPLQEADEMSANRYIDVVLTSDNDEEIKKVLLAAIIVNYFGIELAEELLTEAQGRRVT